MKTFAFETQAYNAMTAFGEEEDDFLDDMQEKAELNMLANKRKQQPKKRKTLQDAQ